jgi:hypothetical protein
MGLIRDRNDFLARAEIPADCPRLVSRWTSRFAHNQGSPRILNAKTHSLPFASLDFE